MGLGVRGSPERLESEEGLLTVGPIGTGPSRLMGKVAG